MARPVKIYHNPFDLYVDGEKDNLLWSTEIHLNVEIEDLLVGICRSFNADKPYSTHPKEHLSWTRLLRVYRNVPILTRQNIQNYLRVGDTQGKKYCKAIELANPFIERMLAQDTQVKRYVDLTYKQVVNGYMMIN